MSGFQRWREGRKPAQCTYEVPKMATTYEAMLRHTLFVNTCMMLDLSIVRTEGPRITVAGRARNVAAFQRRMGVSA